MTHRDQKTTEFSGIRGAVLGIWRKIHLSAFSFGTNESPSRGHTEAPHADSWEALPQLPDRRAVVAADVELYVCGGWDGEHRLSQVERVEPQSLSLLDEAGFIGKMVVPFKW